MLCCCSVVGLGVVECSVVWWNGGVVVLYGLVKYGGAVL